MAGRFIIDLDAPDDCDQSEAGLVVVGDEVWSDGKMRRVLAMGVDTSQKTHRVFELEGAELDTVCDELHVMTVRRRAVA